jgi:hypothetical protein
MKSMLVVAMRPQDCSTRTQDRILNVGGAEHSALNSSSVWEGGEKKIQELRVKQVKKVNLSSVISKSIVYIF